MLRIHQQPVIAAMRQLLRYRRAVGVKKQSQLRLTGAQLFLELRSADTFTHLLRISWIGFKARVYNGCRFYRGSPGHDVVRRTPAVAAEWEGPRCVRWMRTTSVENLAK